MESLAQRRFGEYTASYTNQTLNSLNCLSSRSSEQQIQEATKRVFFTLLPYCYSSQDLKEQIRDCLTQLNVINQSIAVYIDELDISPDHPLSRNPFAPVTDSLSFEQVNRANIEYYVACATKAPLRYRCDPRLFRIASNGILHDYKIFGRSGSGINDPVIAIGRFAVQNELLAQFMIRGISLKPERPAPESVNISSEVARLEWCVRYSYGSLPPLTYAQHCAIDALRTTLTRLPNLC